MKTNYLALAAQQGAECGAYLATLADGGDDSATLHRAAVGFVNRLPLADITLERKIQEQFEVSAKAALVSAK